MIERVRDMLRTRVPTGYDVTEKRTQYWMDEDSAAFCDIAVQGGGHEFALVVVRGGDARRDEFVARVWLRYAQEIWIVDAKTGRVQRASVMAPMLVDETDQLVPVAIAGVRINVGELRG